MHPVVGLVKNAVELYIKNGTVIRTPDGLADVMAEKGGVFVCLKKRGELRGCIGTIEPVAGCVAEEAVRNAIHAATRDGRFPPVGEEELNDLDYTVDVLCEPEEVSSPAMLDPKRYGIIVSKGARRGVLLPDIEGVETAGQQLRIAMLKAGIVPDDKDVKIKRFEVKRFK